MKIGVFDSGMGGKALAASLKSYFPDDEIIVVDDHKNVPYGSKTAEQVIHLTTVAIQPLLEAHCDVIIIACNTATMAAIETLCRKYPAQKFVGIEPMVKPAAELTKSGTFAVYATPVTLASARYKWLVDTYASTKRIIQPDCSTWAPMIEHAAIDRASIEKVINDCCDQGADVIVLGCTHYHWIKNLIEEIAGDRAIVIEPSEAIARRVRSITSETTDS